MRSALTSRRRLARARARAAAPAVSATAERSGLDAALSALIAHQHLIAKVVPDLLVDARELRLEPDLGDVARPREVHAVDALHRSGSSGEDDDAVSQRDRLLEVVRNEHDRRAIRRPQLEELVLHERPGLHVESAGRLGHEKDGTLVDERRLQRRALSNAARQLVRVVARETAKSDTPDPVARAPFGFGALGAAKARTGGDVVEHVLPGKDGIDLEDVPDIPGDALDGLAVDEDVAFAGRLESGDERERRRLAAPGRPDDCAELALPDSDVQVAKRGVRRPRRGEEALGDMAELDGRSRHRRYGAARTDARQAFGRWGRSVHFARHDMAAVPAQDCEMRPRKLASQVLLIQIAIVAATVLASALISFWLVSGQVTDEYEHRSLAIGHSVAAMPDVIEAFADPEPSRAIQPIAEAIRKSEAASFVVVANVDGIRYSHPNPDLIGQRVSTDPSPALQGQSWVGIEQGTLGKSVRAKVPIFESGGKVIGIVSVGFLEEQVKATVLTWMPVIGGNVALALGLGIAGSLLLARRLKRQTFGLQPRDIVALLEQRESMLHGIREGMVATDREGRITLVNDEARRLLGLEGPVEGRRIEECVTAGRMRDVLTGDRAGSDQMLLAQIGRASCRERV